MVEEKQSHTGALFRCVLTSGCRPPRKEFASCHCRPYNKKKLDKLVISVWYGSLQRTEVAGQTAILKSEETGEFRVTAKMYSPGAEATGTITGRNLGW